MTMPLLLNLSEKQQCLDSDSKIISTKKGLMITWMIIRNKGVFLLITPPDRRKIF